MKEIGQGILLHKINYSESSLIITFYTREHGVQKFLFQGAKKKAAPLFPLSVCDLTYYKRPDSELGKLTEATPSFDQSHILFDPVRSTIAFFISDVVRNCLKTDQRDDEVYTFLLEQIRKLDSTDEMNLYPTAFMVDFTVHLGIGLSYDTPSSHYLDLQEGEFTALPEKGSLSVRGPGIELIRSLIDGHVESKTDFSARKQAFDVMLEFYKLHVPRFDVSHSLEIIREVLH